MRPSLRFLLATSLLTLPSLAQDDQIECPDTDLTTYLISLIDTLYSNGLTTSEELIVHLSETDAGYELLESLYMADAGTKWTFMAPTDSAWQNAGIYPPFSGMGDEYGADLMALHALQGTYSASSLSTTSGVGIASTYLLLSSELNVTSSNSDAYQAVALNKGDDGEAVIVDGWWGNGTSWSGFVDTSGANGLGNINILPVDTVIAFPPALSEALTTSGLSNISSAIEVVGQTDNLSQLSQHGFTIFAPIDSAWGDDVKGLMGDSNEAGGLVGNHYTTNYTLFSPAWTDDDNKSFDLPVSSGQTLTIKLNDDGGSSVVLGGVQARILKSDVTLANGVMHVIDTVLYQSNSTSSTASDSASGVAAVATDGASGTNPSATNAVSTIDSSGGGVSSSGSASDSATTTELTQAADGQPSSTSSAERLGARKLYMAGVVFLSVLSYALV
ncbi:hypothetical protein L198_05514 [Cryptococcus wingfieldii CBS 7118]|uniref:FAS1 domain-containing protein n=1 Tax=Cryptococcus wingfieldii CBS 7118 TaxID=1295528 RepID=A0A1E3IVS3_9TREE|nr:hypothetical protein L198_05514 [Cryptococcus wingfieldii CBS 7118]ODN92720.1 hypothetical protein L198_05514 [Cryptococcus wingfieldii CBS 7118]